MALYLPPLLAVQKFCILSENVFSTSANLGHENLSHEKVASCTKLHFMRLAKYLWNLQLMKFSYAPPFSPKICGLFFLSLFRAEPGRMSNESQRQGCSCVCALCTTSHHTRKYAIKTPFFPILILKERTPIAFASFYSRNVSPTTHAFLGEIE